MLRADLRTKVMKKTKHGVCVCVGQASAGDNGLRRLVDVILEKLHAQCLIRIDGGGGRGAFRIQAAAISLQ